MRIVFLSAIISIAGLTACGDCSGESCSNQSNELTVPNSFLAEVADTRTAIFMNPAEKKLTPAERAKMSSGFELDDVEFVTSSAVTLQLESGIPCQVPVGSMVAAQMDGTKVFVSIEAPINTTKIVCPTGRRQMTPWGYTLAFRH